MTGDRSANKKAQKSELRIHLRGIRARAFEADQAEGGLAANRLIEIAEAFLPANIPTCVAGYIPIGGEIDPRPLLVHFKTLGAQLSMPLVLDKSEPLEFRAWSPGDVLDSGAMHTLQPMRTCEIRVPDLFILPLLGFDRRGNRIGQGGGFYDRTIALARERAVAVYGVAFDTQEVDSLPSEPHDQMLDGVITPSSLMVWDENRQIRYLTQN